MELITIVLSSLLTIVGGGGWILDAIAHKQLNSVIDSAEELEVRIDNNPNYQIAQGKLDKLRVAGRGIYLDPDLRIAAVDLETDAIALDIARLETTSLEKIRGSLVQPLQGAFSLTLTEADLGNALNSAEIQAKLESLLNDLIASRAGNTTIAYDLVDPTLDFQDDNQLTFAVTLRRLNEPVRKNQASELNLVLDIGLEMVSGKQLVIRELVGTVNNRPMSSRLLNGFAQGISDRLDFSNLEKQGIFARLLQLEITAEKITIVGFAKMETKSALINSQKLTTIVRE